MNRLKWFEVFLKGIPLFIRSLVASYRLSGRCFPLCVRILNTRIKFKCRRHKTARVAVRGCVYIRSWLQDQRPVVFCLEQGACLEIDGDIYFGPNCRINLSPESSLYLGGKKNEGLSGFTAGLLLLAAKSIRIGKDFLGAWDIFITDSDHHVYGGCIHLAPVVVGDHVWAAPEVSILKGAEIGSDSVVAHKAVVLTGKYPNKSLLGGIPAKRLGEAKEWKR